MSLENWKASDEKKIMMHAVHEHNNASAVIGNTLNNLENKLRANILEGDDIKDSIKLILSSLDKQKKALDYAFTKFKEKYVLE